MAKKTVASLQTSSKRLSKAIKMVKSPKTAVEDSHLKKLPIGTMGSRKGKHEICENRFCGPQGKRD
jgi:hypothetical protein